MCFVGIRTSHKVYYVIISMYVTYISTENNIVFFSHAPLLSPSFILLFIKYNLSFTEVISHMILSIPSDTLIQAWKKENYMLNTTSYLKFTLRPSFFKMNNRVH